MSRTLSATAKRALYAQNTSEAFISLLTLSHPSMATPIRVSGDAVDTTSGSDLFVAYPFEIQLPNDTDDRAPSVTLKIDNVDRTIIYALRGLTGPLSLLIQIVRASNPDYVEVEYGGMQLRSANYDALTISGELTMEDILTQPYPAGRMTPGVAPGLF